jgi:hypothetical protein
VQATRVGSRPAASHGGRLGEQLRIRAQGVAGPVSRVEEIRSAGKRGFRQQLVQGRQAAEHEARKVFGIVTQVERGQLAYRHVHAAQREHRGERSGIRRAELHRAGDAPRAGRECDARHHAAHAVPDQHDVAPAFGNDAGIELRRERLDAETPVVRVQARVEPGDMERKLELEDAEQHRAQCREA